MENVETIVYNVESMEKVGKQMWNNCEHNVKQGLGAWARARVRAIPGPLFHTFVTPFPQLVHIVCTLGSYFEHFPEVQPPHTTLIFQSVCVIFVSSSNCALYLSWEAPSVCNILSDGALMQF